jgi:uncharacterized lipoprotein YehR (DUF1307 family)
MKIMTKLVIVLMIVSLIAMGVGCGEEEAKEIRIGVIGPMQFQMKHTR